jgi:transcriptional regulator with XRE-family HTH domain
MRGAGLIVPTMHTTTLAATPVGPLLRAWRQQRRLSQLDLALDAGVSTRHLSFVETGRAQPSREMLMRLARQMRLPLRERNRLLLAAGFAPAYSEQPLDADALRPAREAVAQLLAGHEPYPALAVDRHWMLLQANAAVGRLLAGVAPALLAPPVNVLKLSLHPAGLAPRIANLAEWRAHLLARLGEQIAAGADAGLIALREELLALGGDDAAAEPGAPGPAAIVVPLRLRVPGGELSLISTTTVFGTPVAVALSELAIESFFPADAATAEALRRLAAA